MWYCLINLQRMRLLTAFLPVVVLVMGSIGARGQAPVADFIATDYSNIRGVNFCAPVGHHLEHWLNYDPKETERDLDYAKRIGINQVRVFLSYSAYPKNKEAFRQHLHPPRPCVPGPRHRADAGGELQVGNVP